MKKQLVKIASNLFPNMITSFAYNQLTNPQVRKLRKNELDTLNKSEKENFNYNNINIKLYTWKGGKNKVLLIHGWEGQAGNFSDLIEILLENGYTVHSFDGPSHGYSSKGSTSLFEFSELVGVLIKKFDVKSLVSHSFGGVATTYALFKNPDIMIEKYVLLTTPDKFTERIDDVSEVVGINKKVKKLLINRLEKQTGISVETLNVSDFVKTINVKDALIIHDINDKVIPIIRSKNVHRNWAASQLKEVEGTGHFRILRTKEVIDTVVNYLN
ncbi:alpha/beta fold hydrolase [Ulvibacter litoralis]|uniref:Alpha/beta hydrolase family protein n=1 Tax=Ulvibacter litoralis TaxID=227084 RepID=A0A1G7H2S8_9FLAO|nr:alpha/beta hydrolase [Ulvibacter litoralis]GHC59105.1 alpha/beta hydrolase [Ulvibacter litoralis]SDE94623.1 Alpha/beta hydrolase family protein [Ulvibacter litoralis]